MMHSYNFYLLYIIILEKEKNQQVLAHNIYLKYRLWLDTFFSMASSEPIPRYFFKRTPSAKKYSPGASVVPARREPIITEMWQIRWSVTFEDTQSRLALRLK